jgi:hypothetical protein
VRRLILALAVAGCASPGFPPGGPPDKDPPKLVAVVPESGAVNVKPKHVTFEFDEVINEVATGPASTASGGGLSGFFLISPRDGRTHVSWHRSTLEVRGDRPFRAKTAYSVTLLPGLADLRGNPRKQPVTVVFSTGPEIPPQFIRGIIFDWAAGRPAPNAVVEALSRPDTTLAYVAQSDSVGRFVLPFMSPGSYTVRGYIDGNNSRTLDPREAWDSSHIELRDSASVELLAFIHDTIGPRVSTVEPRDSLTLHVSFDRAVDPAQKMDTSLFTLRAADSSIVPIRSALTMAEFERVSGDSARRADSLRAVRDTSLRRRPSRDTTTQAPPPKPSKPVPTTEVMLQLVSPLKPVQSYRLETHGLRGLLGATASSVRTFNTPKATATKPDTTKRAVPTDTTHRAPPGAASRRPPSDTARAVKPDTTTRRPPP